MGRGKHFIGDFLPPDELEKFMETFKALKVNGEFAGINPAVGLSSRQPPHTQENQALFHRRHLFMSDVVRLGNSQIAQLPL